jgi:hypothetical protein
MKSQKAKDMVVILKNLFADPEAQKLPSDDLANLGMAMAENGLRMAIGGLLEISQAQVAAGDDPKEVALRMGQAMVAVAEALTHGIQDITPGLIVRINTPEQEKMEALPDDGTVFN